ncbi:MAG: penicillin-binding protein 2, partial [Bifidobacteriaceae bacterium]|nr:penicillin-binding protein 2 [Bifidobacteriaceae bacterium]
SILTSDGVVIAKSDPVNDAFKYARSYPNAYVYAPVTGYFSISQRADRGIEASRNNLLSGQSNTLLFQRIKSVLTGTENKGASIETSINSKLQQTAYNAMQNKDGAIIAIEPSSGRILAMVSTPSYDPNTLAVHNTTASNKSYSSYINDSGNPMLNRTTSELYPPGSTFKTVVAAAALESGKYTLDSQIPAGSAYTLPNTNTVLTNVSAAANGSNNSISLENALAYSSNTAFAQLGIAIGQDAIEEQAKKLGFNSSIAYDGTSTTGMTIQSTVSKFPDKLSDDRLGLASIGQGDTQATVLQMALVASAVANGGKLMNPTLVDRVRSSDLSVLSTTSASEYSQAFSSNTASQLTQMMEAVVTKESTNLAIPGVSVAAKTGTAQIGVDNSSIDGWVIGFAPAQEPKIAIAVVVHNTSLNGSYAAGPIMKQLMEEYLKQ